MSTMATDFAVLESEVNTALALAWREIVADPARVERYQSMFDRAGEAGFYGPDSLVKGQGEQPTWQPNPAYMKSLEAMWEGDGDGSCSQLLGSRGLALERSLYELFFVSREYEDTENHHRRVFNGHVLDVRSGRPLTFFMLTVPHSHERFELTTAPVVAISRTLG
jgi:hypothetical protein